jgi:hypothetical protein
VNSKGSAVVEFALVVPLVLVLVLGVVEVALVARGQLMVINAAREGPVRRRLRLTRPPPSGRPDRPWAMPALRPGFR